MEIKEISNEDFMALACLRAAMYKEMDPSINSFGAVNTLVHEINTKSDFIAIGLFEDNALVGFVNGYAMSKNVFYFSGIYVIIRNNEWIKKLIDHSFTFIKDKGYSAWQVDATNGNISSIMEKYGASVKYTRYYKEMD